MRQLFVICVFSLCLFGYFSAEAKTSVETIAENRKENSNLTVLSFHYNHPANIAQLNQVHHITFNARDQKALPGFINKNGFDHPMPGRTDKHLNVYFAPTYIPLVRLLLFPEHYCW